MPFTGPTSSHEEIRRWAESRGAQPAEVLPHLLDSEPAMLRFVLAAQAPHPPDLRVLSWDEFFVKFDGLGLSFVYDENDRRYYEILQQEEGMNYRHPEYPGESSLN